MPFTSKRQWRAAYAGKIPGVDPHEWAHETKSFKKLPERAPAEKGKATLRSKEAAPLDLAKQFLPAARKARVANLAQAASNKGDLASRLTRNMGQHPMGSPQFNRIQGVRDKVTARASQLQGAGRAEAKAVSSDRAMKSTFTPQASPASNPAPQSFMSRMMNKVRPSSPMVQKAAMFVALEDELAEIFKLAALGTAAMNPHNVGRLKGMMTTHALKAPGYAASTQAVNPGRNIVRAMNAGKPH